MKIIDFDDFEILLSRILNNFIRLLILILEIYAKIFVDIIYYIFKAQDKFNIHNFFYMLNSTKLIF